MHSPAMSTMSLESLPEDEEIEHGDFFPSRDIDLGDLSDEDDIVDSDMVEYAVEFGKVSALLEKTKNMKDEQIEKLKAQRRLSKRSEHTVRRLYHEKTMLESLERSTKLDARLAVFADEAASREEALLAANRQVELKAIDVEKESKSITQYLGCASE